MKKAFFRIICIMLLTVMTVSIAACAEENAADNGTSNQGGNGGNSATVRPENDPSVVKNYYYKPEIADSSVDLVKNGETDHVIVYPAESNSMMDGSVRELKLFFEEATGIELRSYKDSEYTSKGLDNPYISIGQTTMFAKAGLSVDTMELGASGYEIKLIGSNVYIAGGYYGNRYGVYEFLSYEFGFEQYAPDEIHLDKKSSVKIKAFDLKDIPDS